MYDKSTAMQPRFAAEISAPGPVHLADARHTAAHGISGHKMKPGRDFGYGTFETCRPTLTMSVPGADRNRLAGGRNGAIDLAEMRCAVRATFARFALRHLHKPLIASQRRRSGAAAGFRILPRSAFLNFTEESKMTGMRPGLLY